MYFVLSGEMYVEGQNLFRSGGYLNGIAVEGCCSGFDFFHIDGLSGLDGPCKGDGSVHCFGGWVKDANDQAFSVFGTFECGENQICWFHIDEALAFG